MASTAAYDVVVVGAGPAGAATATHLAREGARVLLCDRVRVPEGSAAWRDKACGGGLTPRGVAALQRLKVDLAPGEAIEVGGLEMTGGGRSVAVAFPSTSAWPSYGLVVRRSILDRRILDAAEAAGAELRHARVLGPVFSDGVCRGVRIRGDGGVYEVEAKLTIAADGATSVVARGAGLAPPSASGGFWYTALRGYAGPVPARTGPGGTMLEFYPLRTPEGRWLPAYGWVFPLADGAANIGVDIPHAPSLAACPDLRPAFAAFVERMRRERPGFEGAELIAAPGGALLPEAMLDFRPGAPGLLAVGDAAGMITPYSGEGIAYALEGAELAAAAVASGASPSGVLQRYATSLRQGYGFHFAAAHRIMKAMRTPVLAGAAAAVGMRSPRALRAGVRVMAYLIEDDGSSTVSRGFRLAEGVWRRWRRAA